jgi:methionyl aminopeptidase
MIPRKSTSEIEKMRRSGELAAEILNRVADRIAPGVTTKELDNLAGQWIAEAGAKSAFKGYRGTFPGQLCISVNDEVVHGYGGPRKINYGDIVKLDCGVIFNGYIGDTASTIPVGIIDPTTERLLHVTEQILMDAIQLARGGRRLGDMCSFIESETVRHGYSVVREFVGHGVGRKLHEDPQVPNYGKRGTGPKLKPGMTLAVEPMINLGAADVDVLEDKWTVITRDGSPSAHFEHTILITDGAPEVLTSNRRSLLK